MSQPTWWFVLGHEPLLSLAELNAVLPSCPVLVTKDIARIELQNNPAKLVNQLGGTIKIAKELASGISEDALLKRMADELEEVFGKIHFGLSLYAVPNGANQAEKWGLTLKKQLKTAGKSVRYVDNRGKAILSSVSVDKNGLVDRGREFLIIPMPHGRFGLAATVSVQPFESFSERDFGRPGRDDLSGMLPPKLAIMMTNAASIPKDKALYDPSCGSGTILTEAMLLGYTKLIGSDISPKAIADTKLNSDWMQGKTETVVDLKLFEHDIQTKPPLGAADDIGGVVSEPYLGPPLKGRELPEQLFSNARELSRLYLATFRSFASFLPKGAKIVYVFPRFGRGSALVRTAELVLPELKKLGFTPVPLLPSAISKDPFVLYQREDQHLGREIWKFTF